MVKRGYYDLFFLNQKLIYLAYFILFGYTQKIVKGLYLLLNVVHVSKKGSSLKVSLLILHLFFLLHKTFEQRYSKYTESSKCACYIPKDN